MKILRSCLCLIVLGALSACELTTTTPTPVTDGLATAAESQPAGEEIQADGVSAGTATPLGVSVSKEINPLTGLPVPDSSLLERRPVAVKITLYPRSNRPQWGLSLADIVYEYYHNNELTRLHAIFYGQNAKLAGPIRSARLPDDYLMDMYGSVMAYASADSRIQDRLHSNHPGWQLVSILEGTCPPQPVCRYDPEAFNHLLADTAEVSAYVSRNGGDNTRPDLEGMLFETARPKGGEDVERITTRYSYAAYSYWAYDAVSGRYLRHQDSWEDVGGRNEVYELLTDRLTGTAIAADNVVVLYVPHFHFVYKPAANGLPATEIVDMDFEGRGQAYAFRDGQAYAVEWVRKGDGVLTLEFEDGTPYAFKPGTTFFQVLNVGSELERDGERWRFVFDFLRP
ncbi:MAG: DUF3048 domain-containing protein [Chloroflexi bacterium]|nr:DUF3048 domain-containing protein [Chloroflexota bacterium]